MAFALLYSLGNLVSFASTGFLVGPRKQCRMACDASRRCSTFLFMSSMRVRARKRTLGTAARARAPAGGARLPPTARARTLAPPRPRRLATILTATLYTGAGATVLCILLIVVQFCALVWYTASYIPFGHAFIVSTCKACAGRLGASGAG